MRIGFGYDVHKYSEDRKFILGGVEIPYEAGLLGHSDADVLLHAVMDAILGALALGDIGKHFPDTDEKYKGISSIKLLKYVYEKMDNSGYRIGNIDCTVACQKPKLLPYIDRMRENIADVLNTDMSFISVKATTEEKLGFTGRMEGVKAYCVCLLEEK
ncbi:MAG: 2-C-methyl-D-erythritol 2,4-cyclodiphosphate synthase [Ruminococcaceae bacterium]|nr:2-C-methyl-D-erythritol 2,4-cyclodiphosphate synthase [Oscillospiraceae bacterium]